MVEDGDDILCRHVVVERSAAVVHRSRHSEGVVAVEYDEIRLLLLQHGDYLVDSLAVLLAAPESAAQMDVREHHYLQIPVRREGVVTRLRIYLRHHSVHIAVVNRLEAAYVVPQVERHSVVDQARGHKAHRRDDHYPHRDLPPQAAPFLLFSFRSHVLFGSFFSAHQFPFR